MTLTLTLSPEVEQRLTEEAKRRGLAPDALALLLVEAHLPARDGAVQVPEKPLSPAERRKKLVEMIQSWIDEGDAEEQDETREYLIRVLDEDRLSDRKLFPEELKGITW